MLPLERKRQIVDIILKENTVYVSDLSKKFEVTEETIRRDLEKLEMEGILTRTYGGAILKKHTNEDLPFSTRNTLNKEMKYQIALQASKLVNDKDSLMMDPSSTVFELAELIKDKQDISIITNSLEIVYKYSNNNMQIISTGGCLKKNSLSLVGTTACEAVKKYNVDILFISCKGLSLERGITDSNEPEADLKRHMMQQANTIVLLADHTKFDKIAFAKISDIQKINHIITDKKPSPEWLAYLDNSQVNLHYPE